MQHVWDEMPTNFEASIPIRAIWSESPSVMAVSVGDCRGDGKAIDPLDSGVDRVRRKKNVEI